MEPDRKLIEDVEKRYEQAVGKKKVALLEMAKLQVQLAQIDEEIDQIAKAGPSLACHW